MAAVMRALHVCVMSARLISIRALPPLFVRGERCGSRQLGLQTMEPLTFFTAQCGDIAGVCELG